jgi:Mg2+ and Co2+ transporter CorA
MAYFARQGQRPVLVGAPLKLAFPALTILSSIIHQAHTWDRLLVTRQVFSGLMERENVFPYFLDTVFAFGVRTKDDDNTWPNFHSRVSYPEAGESVDGFGGYVETEGLAVETCYTVRFFERNHRNTGDPWSLRQTGVYQRFDTATNNSVWTLIKPSHYLQVRLRDKLHTLARRPQLRPVRHMLLHLVIVSSTLEGWAEYITTQQDVLERFENKSFFSDADHDTQNDFKLGFEDSQALQHLRRKLIKAMAVLEGGNNLCNRLFGVFEAMETPTQTNAGGLRPFLTKGLSETLVAELKDIISNISYHRQRLVDLQQRSSNATNLLLSILEHRVGNSSLRSARANEASQEANSRSLDIMKTIAVNAELEHSLEQKISINIRALSFVATVYLPASLLAGIFSTELVQYEAREFSASPEFWKFVVILIPMVVVTFAAVYVLQVIWTRRLEEKTARLMDGRWRTDRPMA